MHAAEVVNTEPEMMEDLFVTDGRSKDDLRERENTLNGANRGIRTIRTFEQVAQAKRERGSEWEVSSEGRQTGQNQSLDAVQG